jgi:hypothetical protein
MVVGPSDVYLHRPTSGPPNVMKLSSADKTDTFETNFRDTGTCGNTLMGKGSRRVSYVDLSSTSQRITAGR